MTELRPPKTAERDYMQLPTMIHIATGVDLLKTNQGQAAYRHFAYPQLTEGAPNVVGGAARSFLVDQLITEEDVVRAASTMAGNSSTANGHATIGDWMIGREMLRDFGEDTARFRPQLVDLFHYEVGIVAAEEWVHVLQAEVGGSVTEQHDSEADVAAFLDTHGIDLSLDFVTRYPERIAWYIGRYPNKEEETMTFARQYSRQLTPFSGP
jgi:hypothetical protein